jgi:hypothetical protein
MNLKNYPTAIAKLERKLHRIDVEIRHYQNLVERLTTQIERAIATDPELKNDQQRKAKRLDLMGQPEYAEAVTTLQTQQDERTLLRIDLQLLRDHFRVALLETRQAVAQIEQTLQVA